MPPRITIILAVAENGIIGRDADLPWRLPDDLQRFKRLTTNHPIIMGRRTWESFHGRPLPKRAHIVVTGKPDALERPEGVHAVESLDTALELGRSLDGGSKELFVIGGAGLAEEALARATRLLLTIVHASPDGDTFVRMPGVNAPDEGWSETEREAHEADERNEHPHTFVTLVRSTPNAG